MRRLGNSQHGHYPNVSIESAEMIEGAPVVHLNILAVRAGHQELAGDSERVNCSELGLKFIDKVERVAGPPDV